MSRTLRTLLVLSAVALTACGAKYGQNGPCQADADCQLCIVCGCARVYARADISSATCDAIAKDETCPKTPGAECLSGTTYQPLCVSGHCQAIQK